MFLMFFWVIFSVFAILTLIVLASVNFGWTLVGTILMVILLCSLVTNIYALAKFGQWYNNDTVLSRKNLNIAFQAYAFVTATLTIVFSLAAMAQTEKLRYFFLGILVTMGLLQMQASIKNYYQASLIIVK